MLHLSHPRTPNTRFLSITLPSSPTNLLHYLQLLWREGRADTVWAISQPQKFLFVSLPCTTNPPFFFLYMCPFCILLSFLVPFFLLVLLLPEFFSPEYANLSTARGLQNVDIRNRRNKSSCFCPLQVLRASEG